MSKKSKKKKVDNNLGFLFGSSAVLVVLAISAFNLSVYFGNAVRVEKIEIANDDEQVWLNFLMSNPTYRDGYLELAQKEKERGNLEQYNVLTERARNLDPNSLKIGR